MPDRPVLVEDYKYRHEVEARLNNLAKDPTNRYELKFFNTSGDNNYGGTKYTLVLIWTPE